MAAANTAQQITMNNLDVPNKQLIKSENINCDGANYIYNTYRVKNYGEIECVKPSGRTDGDFRKARALIPFEFIGKKAKDFNWNEYGCEIETQKKIVNAFILNFDKFVNEGKGLYIYSQKKGSGKTFLSCCLLQELIDTRPINAKFITVLDFIELTKKGFKNDGSNDEIDGIFQTQLLVLDDLGVQMNKEWTETVLYRLINYRMTQKLVTIFTSNVPVDKLKMDERISERIFSMVIPLILPEVSIRNRKAQEKNSEFIKGLI